MAEFIGSQTLVNIVQGKILYFNLSLLLTAGLLWKDTQVSSYIAWWN